MSSTPTTTSNDPHHLNTVAQVLRFRPTDYQAAVALPNKFTYYGDTVQSYNAGGGNNSSSSGGGFFSSLFGGGSSSSSSNTQGDTSFDVPARMPHGVGICISPDGQTRYGGQWSRGKRHGRGILISPEMEYEGDFWEDAMHGQCHIKYKRKPGIFGAIKSVVATQPKEYTGDIHRDHGLHGKGHMIYSNDEQYDGDFYNGQRSGRGVQTTEEGERYEGQWENDERHGTGVLALASGSQYLGMFQNGKRHGHGKMLRQNGDVFVGDFVADEMRGNGVMTYRNGDTYSGEWRFNTRHGRGIFKLAEKGAVVSGTFVSGLLQGDGTVEIPGKSVFVGEFSHGERIFGTMWLDGPAGAATAAPATTPRPHEIPSVVTSKTTQDPAAAVAAAAAGATAGAVSAQGVASNDAPMSAHQQATAAAAAAAASSSSSSSSHQRQHQQHAPASPSSSSVQGAAGVYHGPFRGDGVHGNGLFWYPDGSFYAGSFVNGRRQGPGYMRHVDGTEYSGEFFQDERHGRGILRLPSGQIACGIFDTDCSLAVGYFGEWDPSTLTLCGRGTFIEENGAVYEGLVQGSRREMLGTLSVAVELVRSRSDSNSKKSSKEDDKKQSSEGAAAAAAGTSSSSTSAESPSWPNPIIGIVPKYGAARAKALKQFLLEAEEAEARQQEEQQQKEGGAAAAAESANKRRHHRSAQHYSHSVLHHQFKALSNLHIRIPGIAPSTSCCVHHYSQLAAPSLKKKKDDSSSSSSRDKKKQKQKQQEEEEAATKQELSADADASPTTPVPPTPLDPLDDTRQQQQHPHIQRDDDDNNKTTITLGSGAARIEICETEPSARLTYRGGFVANSAHGEGTLVLEDSDGTVLSTYAGMWAGGEPCGDGVVSGPLCARRFFIGDWLRGRPHGSGRLYDPGTDLTSPVPADVATSIQTTASALQRLLSLGGRVGGSSSSGGGSSGSGSGSGTTLSAAEHETARLAKLRRGAHKLPYVAVGEWLEGEAYGPMTLFLAPSQVVVAADGKRKQGANDVANSNNNDNNNGGDDEAAETTATPTTTTNAPDHDDDPQTAAAQQQQQRYIRKVAQVPMLHSRPKIALPHAPSAVASEDATSNNNNNKSNNKSNSSSAASGICPLCKGHLGASLFGIRFLVRCRCCARMGCSACCTSKQLPSFVPTASLGEPLVSPTASTPNGSGNNDDDEPHTQAELRQQQQREQQEQREQVRSGALSASLSAASSSSSLVSVTYDEHLDFLRRSREHALRNSISYRGGTLGALAARILTFGRSGDLNNSNANTNSHSRASVMNASSGGGSSNSAGGDKASRDVFERTADDIARHIADLAGSKDANSSSSAVAAAAWERFFSRPEDHVFTEKICQDCSRCIDRQTAHATLWETEPLTTMQTQLAGLGGPPPVLASCTGFVDSNSGSWFGNCAVTQFVVSNVVDNGGGGGIAAQYVGGMKDGQRSGFGTLLLSLQHYFSSQQLDALRVFASSNNVNNNNNNNNNVDTVSLLRSLLRSATEGYRGSWKNGKRHGEGVYRFFVTGSGARSLVHRNSNNNSDTATAAAAAAEDFMYLGVSGEWRDGQPVLLRYQGQINPIDWKADGRGIGYLYERKKKQQRNEEASSAKPVITEVYNGSWKSGKPHGVGIVNVLSADIATTAEATFVGYFRDGKRHGPGKSMCPAQGRITRGVWVDGHLHGRVEIEDPNVVEFGLVLEGQLDGPVWSKFSSPVEVPSSELHAAFEKQQMAELVNEQQPQQAQQPHEHQQQKEEQERQINEPFAHDASAIDASVLPRVSSASGGSSNSSGQQQVCQLTRRVLLYKDGTPYLQALSQPDENVFLAGAALPRCECCNYEFGVFSGFLSRGRSFCRCCGRVTCMECVSRVRLVPQHLRPFSKITNDARAWRASPQPVCPACSEAIKDGVAFGCLFFDDDDGLVYVGQLERSGTKPLPGGYGLWCRRSVTSQGEEATSGSSSSEPAAAAAAAVVSSSEQLQLQVAGAPFAWQVTGGADKQQQHQQRQLTLPRLHQDSIKAMETRRRRSKNDDDDDVDDSASPAAEGAAGEPLSALDLFREWWRTMVCSFLCLESDAEYKASDLHLDTILALAASPPSLTAPASASVPPCTLVPPLSFPNPRDIGLPVGGQMAVLQSGVLLSEDDERERVQQMIKKQQQQKKKQQQQHADDDDADHDDEGFDVFELVAQAATAASRHHSGEGAAAAAALDAQNSTNEEHCEEAGSSSKHKTTQQPPQLLFHPPTLPPAPDAKPRDPVPLTHEEVDHAVARTRIHSAEQLGITMTHSSTTASAVAAAAAAAAAHHHHQQQQHNAAVPPPQHHHLGPIPPPRPPLRTPFAQEWNDWRTKPLPPGLLSALTNDHHHHAAAVASKQQVATADGGELADGGAAAAADTTETTTTTAMASTLLPFLLTGSEGCVSTANSAMADAAKFAPPPISFLDSLSVPSLPGPVRLAMTHQVDGVGLPDMKVLDE